MFFELSKSQKKTARVVMDKGLENHYIRALSDVETILLKWRNGQFKGAKLSYMKLFQCVKRNDNNIAGIYNDKGGSRWVEVMAMQLADRVITLEDIRDFDDEVRETIIAWSEIK
jgi:hypothetical protein